MWSSGVVELFGPLVMMLLSPVYMPIGCGIFLCVLRPVRLANAGQECNVHYSLCNGSTFVRHLPNDLSLSREDLHGPPPISCKVAPPVECRLPPSCRLRVLVSKYRVVGPVGLWSKCLLAL